MKRDWDCIRAILAALEGKGDTTSVVHANEVHGFDAETASYHMRLMIQAGLIEGSCSDEIGAPLDCSAIAMTWDGHELRDKTRSDTAWNKIKASAREKGVSLSFDLVKLLATKYVIGLFS
jgi:hypothetical protein